ncbi:hypothetical protein Rhal01_00817 [Rubritalea halochordaticola]|uniref:Plasmid pRiA4b Orf3-like domain-containing protein n=1 Tax=Rubritalea halochordaticola TaxID=714537 RepID=A0ABP9UW12_9BACT
MSEHYELKVILYGIEPLIWREISVPAETTFGKLHKLLQAAMGWEDKHSHEFRHGKGRNLTSVVADGSDVAVIKGEDFKDENELTLKQLIGRKHFPFRMLYRYDFSDDWIHELNFQRKSEGSGKCALIDGERNCPPEDCGGSHGYQNCADGVLEWMDDDYDPSSFDKKAAEKRISKLK